MKSVRLIIMVLLWLITMPIAAQSDDDYARGVELYNAGKYREAIECFEKVTAIDRRTMPADASFAHYGEVWAAACYYQLGDTEKAKALNPESYMMPPVDRRLVVESDRMADKGMFFYNSGNMEKALEYFTETSLMEKKALGEHYYYANTLGIRCNCLMQLGRPAEVLPLADEALSIFKAADYQIGMLQSYDIRGWGNYYLGNIDAASDDFEHVSAIAEALGDSLNMMSSRLAWVQMQRMKGGNPDDLLPVLAKIKECFARLPEVGTNHPIYANVLVEEANNMFNMLLPECEERANEARRIYEANGMTAHRDYGLTLYLIAIYALKTDAKDAYEKNLASKQWFEKCNETASTEYLQMSLSTASLAYRSDRIGESEYIATLKTVMEKSETLLGTRANDVFLDAFSTLGEYYQRKNDPQAERIFDEANAIAEGMETLNPELRLRIRSNFANKYIDANDVNNAVETLIGAAEEYEKSVVAPSAKYLETLSALVPMLTMTGNYDQAIAIGEKNLRLLRDAKATDNMYFASLLMAMRQPYEAVGNFQKAQESVMKAWETLNNLGERSLRYYMSLENVAEVLLQSGDVNNAKMMAKGVLDANETIGSNMLESGALMTYVNCLFRENDREELRNVLPRAREAITKAYSGVTQMSWIVNMIDLYEKVIDEDTEGMRHIMEKTLTQYDNSFFASNMQNRVNMMTGLADIYSMEGDTEKMIDMIGSIDKAVRELVANHFLTMTYAERCDFWAKFANWFNGYVPNSVYRLPEKSMLERAYDGMLLAKGLLLNSEVEVKRLVEESEDEETKQMYRDLQKRKTMLAQSRNEMKPEAADSLQRLMYDEEKTMMQRSKALGDYMKNLLLTWHDVQRRLKEGDVAVEFMVSPLTTDSLMYSALVLRPGYEAPRLLPLFSEEEIKGIGKEELYGTDYVYKLLWQKMEGELKGAKRVFFAPSAQLYAINIESVPMSDGRLISDKYELYRLSSTRELVVNSKGNGGRNDAVLFGGIDYDADEKQIAEAQKTISLDTENGKKHRYANRERGGISLREGIMPLQATKKEVEKIAKTMSKSNIDARMLVGAQASEEAVKALSGKSPKCLHIATHGFFWNEEQASENASLSFLQQTLLTSLMGEHTAVAAEDKMLTRSGLLFAGASMAMTGIDMPENMENGILTAQEIASLDLRGTDLVVLSACETARGEITGDGVFGLQRGFKKAGARTLVMSLWKVDDDATQLLMTEFYRNLATGKKSRRQSLKDAQQFLRTEHGKKYSDPKYWAAFILLDDEL